MNKEEALIINTRTTDHISQQTRAWGYLECLEKTNRMERYLRAIQTVDINLFKRSDPPEGVCMKYWMKEAEKTLDQWNKDK